MRCNGPPASSQALDDRYPLKLFNRLWPLEQWDTEEWLPRIHAVELLAAPHGGGSPVSPQEVFDKLLPYRTKSPCHQRDPQRGTRVAMVRRTV
jgi:hypothetical protein